MKLTISISGTSLPRTYTGKSTVRGIKFDQEEGIGNTPFSQDPLYYGFVAYMTTKAFLTLASEGTNIKEDENTEWLFSKIGEGQAISSPTLFYDVEKHEIDGHEGRHRCYAIMKFTGDIVIPVVVKFRGEYRGRSATQALVEKFNASVKSQRGDVVKNTIEAYYSNNDKFVRLQD